MPAFAPGLLAAAIAGSFLPDLLGMLSGMLAASLLMAYAILGLAVLHAITRGMASRTVLLRAPMPPPSFSAGRSSRCRMLGLADTAFNIRGRMASKRGPPTLPT